MKLDRTTPLLVPLTIQIDDQIQSPMPPMMRVIVEVHVWIKLLPWAVLMCAATYVQLVVKQVGDSCNIAH